MVLLSSLQYILTLLSQFNIYEPEKIRSHAGVRSDLFNRPLGKTLITDFFGGVAQAEVVSTDAIDQDRSSHGADQNQSTDQPSVIGENSSSQQSSPGIMHNPTTQYDDFSSWLRAWGGLGLVGILVSFVVLIPRK